MVFCRLERKEVPRRVRRYRLSKTPWGPFCKHPSFWISCLKTRISDIKSHFPERQPANVVRLCWLDATPANHPDRHVLHIRSKMADIQRRLPSASIIGALNDASRRWVPPCGHTLTLVATSHPLRLGTPFAAFLLVHLLYRFTQRKHSWVVR